MSRNLPTFGKDEEKYEQGQRQAPIMMQQQQQQYDSNSMLFRPMPTWVIQREKDAIARIPTRPGEDGILMVKITWAVMI